MSGDHESAEPGHNDRKPSANDGRGPSLPPPAFPPGSRRHQVRKASASAPTMDGAFISPDEPMPERGGPEPGRGTARDAPPGASNPDDAFISPDEPIPHRAPHGPQTDSSDEGGIATGMGDDAHMTRVELTAGGDPYVLEVVAKVGKLAAALKRRGEAGLRTTAEMDRFDATLRAYCVGYLAGRRAQDDDTPDY